MLLAPPTRDNKTPAVFLVLALCSHPGAALADEVRSWRDSDGQLHVEIVGDGERVDPDAEGLPMISTSDLSADEKLSIRASHERRRIRRGLEKAARLLEEVRSEAETLRQQELVTWSPGAADGIEDPRRMMEAQQNAFLAAERFRRHKEERLAELAAAERKNLRTMRRLWDDFEKIRTEVRDRFGSSPEWWRDEIDCGACLSAAEVERALRPPDEDEDAPEEEE